MALKFIAHADDAWQNEQSKRIGTEIEALKRIKHDNILRLYAYNLDAKYPIKHKHKKYISAVLLVTEYAPNGELFNLSPGRKKAE